LWLFKHIYRRFNMLDQDSIILDTFVNKMEVLASAKLSYVTLYKLCCSHFSAWSEERLSRAWRSAMV
jgi:hypothetical protein